MRGILIVVLLAGVVTRLLVVWRILSNRCETQKLLLVAISGIGINLRWGRRSHCNEGFVPSQGLVLARLKCCVAQEL